MHVRAYRARFKKMIERLLLVQRDLALAIFAGKMGQFWVIDCKLLVRIHETFVALNKVDENWPSRYLLVKWVNSERNCSIGLVKEYTIARSLLLDDHFFEQILYSFTKIKPSRYLLVKWAWSEGTIVNCSFVFMKHLSCWTKSARIGPRDIC